MTATRRLRRKLVQHLSDDLPEPARCRDAMEIVYWGYHGAEEAFELYPFQIVYTNVCSFVSQPKKVKWSDMCACP